jgi:hypothetical protein
VIKKLKVSNQKVRLAQILLKADGKGANWIDERLPKPSVVTREQWRIFGNDWLRSPLRKHSMVPLA